MKKATLGMGLLAVLALSAVAASSASAAATTTAAQWYTGASPGTTLTSSAAINASIGTDPVVGAKFVLESEVGTTNIPIKLTATSISCSGCTIENKEVTSKSGKVAFGTGKFIFGGVTVDEPAGCTVSTGIITTKAINVHADFMNGVVADQQFFPVSGTTFASFELEGTKCGVAGLYPVKGTLFADAVNATGTFATSQVTRVSPAIEDNDGGGLAIGTKEANLTGTTVITLSSGAAFAIK